MPNGPTDDELLKRYLKDGAQDAFATLVERYLALVYGVALRRLHDPAPAQEVTQNVFITLARQAVWLTEHSSQHSSLGGWLYRTTLHLAQHEWRAEQRRRKREKIALELGTCMKTDDSLLSTIAPLLDEAMLELRSADREALLLRYFANKSLREVGAALGIREDAAQKRVSKALDALVERFRRRGFRVAGAAALALALQESSAHALPVGLAFSTTQAALSAGTAASLGGMTMPIVKFMSLTKIQTAALCVSLAALPLGYQWCALGNARSLNGQMTAQLQTLRSEALARERGQARAERQLALAQSALSKPTTGRREPLQATPSGQEKNLYVWDENSPYVRVPKQFLSQLRFAPFGTRVGRDGKTEQYQLPPLAADGSPQAALAAALGLSADEAGRLSALCQNEFAEFYRLAASHSQLTEQPFAAGTMSSATLNTTAFPDDGAQFRDQFKDQVTALLGSERADAFWQQATPVFSELFNDFGANARQLQLIKNPRGLELMNASPGGAAIGLLSQRNGLPLPPPLQAYADAWSTPQGDPSIQPPPQ
jgi:RNA polymerase sigma factor (sigma-70 family)